MQYLLSLTDKSRQHMVVLTLREMDVKRNAADFFFDVVGNDAEEQAGDGIIAAGQIEDMKAIQKLVFAQDAQGPYIRDEVMIYANGKQLDPDGPMSAAFSAAERDGVKYMRCDASVSLFEGLEPVDRGAAAAKPVAQNGETDQEQLNAFARMMFIHQIAIGFLIDVTKELPELIESIAEAEKHEWIEIDVQKAAYKLTPEGGKMYGAWMAKAQDLIKRYDIYGDVDIASDGSIRFDTKLGRDLRIAMLEYDGVDPFRARYLIGLNDGEWDNISDWYKDYRNEGWYETLMRDVETAPMVDALGRDTVARVLEKGKEQLRMDSRFR